MQLTFNNCLLQSLQYIVCMPNLFLMSIQMHFDDGYGAYFDFGNHTEKVWCIVICVWYYYAYCCKITNTWVPYSWLRMRFSLHNHDRFNLNGKNCRLDKIMLLTNFSGMLWICLYWDWFLTLVTLVYSHSWGGSFHL